MKSSQSTPTPEISRLKNGLTVISVDLPHMASVSVGIWVGVGGRYEPAPVNGSAHFIEHMLFKGTRKRSAREISQSIEGLGGYLNAFTGEESTCFYARARHDHFAEILAVLADMFLHSTFDPSEVDKERNVIKEELAMYLDQPQQHVQELLNETLWPDQPLGRPLTGSEKTLDGLGRAELLAFKNANYVSGSTLISVAGNIRHKQAVREATRLVGKLAIGKRPCFIPATPDQTVPRLKLFTKETEQTQVAIGIRTCSRHDERRYALRLLNTIAGENMSSRLFQVVREDHGLAYSISSSLSAFDDVGVQVISAGLETEKLEKALRLVLSELQRLADKAVGIAELRRARDYAIGQFDLHLESTENQMMWAAEQLLHYGRLIPPTEFREHLAEVTPAAVRAVARDFYRPDRMNLALVSPVKNSVALEKLFTFA